MIRFFTRQREKLHSEDGQAMVFVVMIGLLIFLFFAMTMNLAEVVQIKIKNQNTADAAALSAAVWQARALNTVSALNQNILDFWVSIPIELIFTWITSSWCVVLCCYGQCPTNDVCVGCILLNLIKSWADILGFFNVLETSELQDEVMEAFDNAFLEQDLQTVTNMNFDFKENTKDIDTELFLYLNENNGNLFLENGGGPGVDFVLERGGWCELILGILYNYCRGGLFCPVDSWAEVLAGIYGQMGNVGAWYSPGGSCFGSSSTNSPWGEIENMNHLFPYVLRTFRNTPGFPPVDPEEALPLTTGLYREEQPPVLHLWGSGLSEEQLDCQIPPEEKENWFPCTSEGHFSFASAHAYSPSVADFYWHLYGSDGNMGYTSRYPIPAVPAITDWEARLFPMEPLLEQNGRSRHSGWAAYDDIAAQVGSLVGAEEETFLRDNMLEQPSVSNNPFFLY